MDHLSIQDLPPEVNDRIVGLLAAEPTGWNMQAAHLKAFSLSCKNFAALARPHLFASLWLDGTDAARRWHATCATTPDIPRCVRSLRLSLPTESLSWDPRLQEHYFTPQEETVAQDEWLAPSLKTMELVQTVEITSISRAAESEYKPRCEMNLMPRANFAALVDLVNLTTVTRLDLRDCVNVPLRFFPERPLKSISLHAVSFQESSGASTHSGHADDVQLSYGWGATQYPCPPQPYMASVTSIDLFASDENAWQVRALIKAVSESLKTLTVGFIGPCPPSNVLIALPPFDLAVLSNLSCLWLRYDEFWDDDAENRSRGNIAGFLKLLDILATWLPPAKGGASKLSELHLVVEVTAGSLEPGTEEHALVNPEQTAAWWALDRVLADAHVFPALRDVQFEIGFIPAPLVDYDEIRSPATVAGRAAWQACLESAETRVFFPLLAAKGVDATPSLSLSTYVPVF